MVLKWISPADLDLHIEGLMKKSKNAAEKASRRRSKNVIDPFSSLLISATYIVNEKSDLEKMQNIESGVRGMSNALGDFHQKILSSVDGWNNHDAGYDLECPDRCILAEIKNKWNTMNAGGRRGVLSDLETAIRQKSSKWCGYLVIIIPKNNERYEISIGDSKIIEIDGASFYHKVTGDPNAIHDLFDALCDKISPSSEVANYCRKIMEKSLPPRI